MAQQPALLAVDGDGVKTGRLKQLGIHAGKYRGAMRKRLWSPTLLAPRHWPLPGGCWVCRAWGRDRICSACVERFAAPQWRCQRCALPAVAPLSGAQPLACGPCQREPLPLDAIHAALDFVPPWDGLLHALKYQGALALAEPLCALLLREAPPLPADALLLPVPLHDKCLGQRGYNQSSVLAQALARLLERAAPQQALLRVVDTPPQTQLGRKERQANLSHAFALAPGHSVQGRHCVLVDDVMTTGATLATLATLLRRHGAQRVDAWVIARTPEPD
jgi:ComF family protein